MGGRVVADDDDSEMRLCALLFQVSDAVEQFCFNLRSARFPVQTSCWHELSTLMVALSVPSRTLASQRRFDADGSNDAPAGSCFKDGESTAKDATGHSVPSESNGDHIRGQEGCQNQ